MLCPGYPGGGTSGGRLFHRPDPMEQREDAATPDFISALEHTGVEVVYGRFAPTQKGCTECGKLYGTHEEKETDVNISTRIIRDALVGDHATLYIMTGDSDQVATIKTAKTLAPESANRSGVPCEQAVGGACQSRRREDSARLEALHTQPASEPD